MSEKKPATAAVLADLACERFTFGVSDTGEPYALPIDGPRIVRMLRGGTGSLRAELAATYRERTGAVAPQQALADAMTALEGIALSCRPRALALRVAEHEGRLWLDLGDETGDVVRIDTEGWAVVAEAPVLHRRTALTAALPRPEGATGDLRALWDVLNVAEPDRAVLVAFLVAALMPDMPHPILLLTGEQGTGKSTASRVIAGIVDPSTVPLRKPPRDLDSWTTAAMGSHVVAVDNLSTLPDWFSDALCRASTGDGDVKRALYTNGDLYVFAFRRVVLLNGIDLGAVRDDLADRLVTVDLHRIEERERCRDADLTSRWAQAHAAVLVGLLDLTAEVLRILPTVQLERSPRMADFARVLAAVDVIAGTDGMGRYLALAGDLATDAVTSDPVLSTLATAVRAPWTGAAVELLETLTAALGDVKPPREWPRNARALGTILKRRAPSLRRLGWAVDQTGEKSERGQLWRLAPPDELPDGLPDEILTGSSTSVSSAVRQPFRQPRTSPLICEDVETAQNPDGLTGRTPFLSVDPEQERETREVPDSPSFRQVRQPSLTARCRLHQAKPRPDVCFTCETVAAS